MPSHCSRSTHAPSNARPGDEEPSARPGDGVPPPEQSGSMIPISALPTLNATLNALSAVLLLVGYRAIRRREIAQHRLAMGAAFATSMLFLVSYVIYHANTGSKHYAGGGALRTVYLVVLVTHVVLAALIVPLATTTLILALRGSFARHRRLARWTFPVWLYVSATGVFVYLMLYHGPGR